MSVLGCLLTMTLILTLAQLAGRILDPRFAQDGIDVVKAFESLDENSMDVIVYGSSRAWKGCDTRVMYDKYGINAYNYSANWLSINTTFLFLQNSLKSQKPKIALIETGLVNQIEKDVDLDGQIYCTRFMRPSKEKRDFLKTCFGRRIDRYASYYFPIIMFHDNWNQIDYENFIKPDTARYHETRGFYPSEGFETFEEPDYENFAQFELDYESIDVLDNMVKICRDNDIEVLFFTIPYADEYNYSDAMKNYAMTKNCSYINLFEHMDEMNLDFSADLKDYEHLNEDGAGKVANYLAEIINDNLN